MRHKPLARSVLLLLASLFAAACAAPPRANDNEVLGKINDVLLKSSTERQPQPPGDMDKAMMPPLVPQLVSQLAPETQEAETRFDLSVVNAPAEQVFMALVSGTRYSMLLPPDLAGSISVNLKEVTLQEALDTIRELYGYEFRIQGRRIFIEPNTIKTRIFQINYLDSKRAGSSELRVTGTSPGGSDNISSNRTSSSTSSTSSTPGSFNSSSQVSRSNDASRVSMLTDSDFWGELEKTMSALMGEGGNDKGAKDYVINRKSGVIMVRALPSKLRDVEKYLRATQLIAERQVMLEAKIIDVQLNDSYQSGINWATFGSGRANSALGVLSPGTGLTTSLATGAGQSLMAGSGASTTGAMTAGAGKLAITPGQFGSAALSALGGGFVGLAFQTANFAALLNFLETQGSVSVLSSPRIATLNNQKAVLKIGNDDFYVTDIDITQGTQTIGGVQTSVPIATPRFQSMFSGISLDVTPQIDESNNIILHVHPAVVSITENNKSISLGGNMGNITMPMARSEISETDSIVRVQDGNIVAIGGLMRQTQAAGNSGLPGASTTPLLGQQGSSLVKRELVILIKPTLIQNDRTWADDLKNVQERVQALQPVRPAAQ